LYTGSLYTLFVLTTCGSVQYKYNDSTVRDANEATVYNRRDLGIIACAF